MSKLSFRARALDASRPMAVYKADEIPDLPDFAAINRAVPQMPTGMEKEEETEHHLQRALSAQQVYGTAEALVIPVPDVEEIPRTRYNKSYRPEMDFKPPKQYVHVQVAFGMEQEIPDYDMDSDDEMWLTKQAKKMEVTPLKFENMMDRLEKGSGQTVVTLQEAKALLKEDDDLIIAVYDYWLNKRLKNVDMSTGANVQTRLIPQVKTEKRDGSSTNDPYVAFRRRTEKMQTRKNRKNDESSYEKMLKLRRDLNKALLILESMKRREKSKKEMLQLTVEIYEKRYQMCDWSGTALAEALAKRHSLPSFVIPDFNNRQWPSRDNKKRREYKKKRHKNSTSHQVNHQPQPSVQLPQYNEMDVHNDGYTSEEELSPVSPSDHEAEDDPDGIYAFRRKANCFYQAPINDGLGNWPWCGHQEGGLADRKYRYNIASITSPRRCIGFARRRMGRGGRLLLDRISTEWDEGLTELDLTCSSPPGPASPLNSLFTHIKENKYPHFRPRTPTAEEQQCSSMMVDRLSPTAVSVTPEFNVESYQDHQEQLLAMQRHQQEQLLKQEADLDSSFDLDHSFSSQPTSRFTLDSARAHFAASAVCNSTKELLLSSNTDNCVPSLGSLKRTNSSNSLSGAASSSSLSSVTLAAALATPVSLSSGANAAANNNVCSTQDGAASVSPLTNGPIENKVGGLSTSPQASVLQLNYPLVTSSFTLSSTVPLSQTTLSSALLAPSPASSPVLSLTSATVGLLSSSVGSTVSTLGAATRTLPVIATKVVTPTAPNVLKLGVTPNRNDTLPKDNHEGVNNIVKEKVVAMEVT